MALATVLSRAAAGLGAPQVFVEAHLSNGLPKFSIVGLPEAAVKESRDRVRAALLSAQFNYPPGRITVNLAPADLPKEGGRFDLPIAVGILAASGQIPTGLLAELEFLGELALDGALREIRGALPVVVALRGGGRRLVLPHRNLGEASLVRGVDVLGAEHLLEVAAFLRGEAELAAPEGQCDAAASNVSSVDLADVRGQQYAKRALEVAAAGGHGLLLIGPPGTGKTMLATRLPGLLPPMCEDEALVSAAVHSLS
nr:ATP-dependent protease [Gammaproteobacteria bacterium]